MAGNKNLHYRKMELFKMEVSFIRATTPAKPKKSDIEISMDKFHYNLIDSITARDIFIAWSISPAIIAERLRRAGFEAKASEIERIIKEGIKEKNEGYLLSVAIMEMRNDITKTLYPNV